MSDVTDLTDGELIAILRNRASTAEHRGMPGWQEILLAAADRLAELTAKRSAVSDAVGPTELARSQLIDPTEIAIANVFQEELEWFDRQDWDGINRSESTTPF